MSILYICICVCVFVCCGQTNASTFCSGTAFCLLNFISCIYFVFKYHALQNFVEKLRIRNQELLHISVVLAEWKPPVYDNESGITLVTATTRRNSPNVRS